MTDFRVPYNFVPLSSFILRPEWAAQVSQDYPFSDGYSGELTLQLIARSPLCVGGKQTPPNRNQPGKVAFHRNPDGQPEIPGSSLKGMLRNVMEIATFGHFRDVENQKLGFRDLTRPKYIDLITKEKVKAGWLSFEDGNWHLRPCRFVRVHQRALHEHFGVAFDTWKQKKTAPRRYQTLGGLRSVSFNTRPRKNSDVDEAHDLGQGTLEGTVVVTGQPGPDYTRGKSAKKHEFVFYDAQPRTAIVRPRVMADFNQIHEDTEEWDYWKKQLNKLALGVPVFYHSDTTGAPRSIGLSMMYKVAYSHSLHDAIGHTQREHLQEGVDLAALIFGQIEPDAARGAHSLRGRVMPGQLSPKVSPSKNWVGPTVLSSPKPTFYPAYLEQSSPAKEMRTLMDSDARLAGWKRYPAHPNHGIDVPPPPEKSQNTVQTTLETVGAGTVFEGKVRFHNLRAVELGALLWCLDFGLQPEICHSLGTGKPIGLGQVGLSLTDADIRSNNPQHQTDDQAMLSQCREAFVGYMNEQWQQATGDTGAIWTESEQVQSLLAMANPGVEKSYLGHMPDLEDFTNIKKSKQALQHPLGGYNGIKPKPGATAKSQDLSLGPAQEPALAADSQSAKMAPEEAELQQLKEQMAQPMNQVPSSQFGAVLDKTLEAAVDWPPLFREQLADDAHRFFKAHGFYTKKQKKKREALISALHG